MADRGEGATYAGILASLDEATARDAEALAELMHRITGHEPEVWNVATLGFDRYRFRYASGREGESHALAFYPRQGRITVYLMDGTARHADALAALGRHTTSRVCVYLRRLDDVDPAVLEAVLRDSYAYLREHDGHVLRA